MATTLVVLLRLQLGVETDTADDAVEWIATDTSAAVVVALDTSILPTCTSSLALRPPQQPAQSVKVGPGRLGRHPETRGHGRPEVDLLLQLVVGVVQ